MRREGAERLLGRNLGRAMHIASLVNDWSETRNEPLRRSLKRSLDRISRSIERGEITPRQALDRVNSRARPFPRTGRAESGAIHVDELMLIFPTAMSHAPGGRLGLLREYTIRCIHHIARCGLPRDKQPVVGYDGRAPNPASEPGSDRRKGRSDATGG